MVFFIERKSLWERNKWRSRASESISISPAIPFRHLTSPNTEVFAALDKVCLELALIVISFVSAF